jgi:ergothioneine biosynthesis protein EgtB
MRSVLAVDRSTPGPITSSSPLAAQYVAVRQTTETLCAPLSTEDQMVQSMPDASPSKWHQAHTSWFFETFILLPNLKGYRALDERYTFFFNSYYKQLGVEKPTLARSAARIGGTWGTVHPVRAQRGLWSRPSLDDIQRYRRHVDEHMLKLLETEIPADVAALVVLGLNHEQQHQELIVTDIKHALWTNPLRPTYRERETPHVIPLRYADRENVGHPMHWIEYPGRVYSVGYEGDGFSFDNETPRHQVLLRSFRIASRLVTNAEYMEFMSDAGYSRPELWLSDAWDTVCTNKWQAPFYWEQRDGEWRAYTLNGECKVDPAEPVCHVSFYEADAYARWAGARLATEFEWEAAAAKVPVAGNLLESDELHPGSTAHSLGAPSPKGEGCGTRESSSSELPVQLFGDVWEWTASSYVAYPGFRPAAGVLGEYNGKFMCNQMVLRGGSCATPASHIRATYRNFFPPHVRWQFSGIRLAHD